MALLSLTACDRPKASTPPPPPGLSIVAVGGTTFLIRGEPQKIFALRNGEFIEVPLVTDQSYSGKAGLRSFHDALQDLSISTALKYHDGKLLYDVTVSPRFTKEYDLYLSNWLSALRTKKPLPQAPPDKFINPRWQKLLEVEGNTINIGLADADGFEIKRILLPVAGGSGVYRDRIIGMDGKTQTAVRYQGVMDMTSEDFSRISATHVSYVLQQVRQTD